MAEAGLARLEELAKDPQAPREHVDDLRGRHARRLHHLSVEANQSLFPEKRGYFSAYRRLRGEMIAAERRMLIRLRDDGVISDSVMHVIQYDLDLESSLLEHDEEHDRPAPQSPTEA